jgi:very-short-patch-repair endonuclease
MENIIDKINNLNINESVCDIELIAIELNKDKSRLVHYLKKHFKNNTDYTFYKVDQKYVQHGGNNRNIYKLTEKTINLIKESYDLKHRYISKLENINIVNVIMTLENSTIGFICNSFKNIIKCERQFKIGKYPVDLYLPELNLVIECDENGHKNYNVEEEIIREKYIKDKLNSTIIRYDPNDINFDLSNIINEILQYFFKNKIV